MDSQLIEGAFVLLLSAIALYFAYRVYDIYRHKSSAIGWLAISVSLAIILARRLLSSYSNAFPSSGIASLFNSYEWIILSFISIIQIYAFWKVKSIHDEERRVEEETMVRIRKFEIERSRHEMRQARAKSSAKKAAEKSR